MSRLSVRLRKPRVIHPFCPKSKDSRHLFVREVRDAKGPGMKQDRMLCKSCRVVLYPWGSAFKPRPEVD